MHRWKGGVVHRKPDAPFFSHAYRLHVLKMESSIGAEYDAVMTPRRPRAAPAKKAKKKPAGESGLKTIFLEENSGDRCIMRRRKIYV
jgi:hypothetical protein